MVRKRLAAMKKVFSAVLAVLAVIAGTVGMTASPAAARYGQYGQPEIVINPGGGTLASSADGLKVYLNGTTNTGTWSLGSDQYWYVGTEQFCCSGSAPMLNIGGTLFGQAGPAEHSGANWTSLEILSTTGSATTTGGTATGSGSATVRYTATKGELTYTMDRLVQYTFPNDHVTESFTFTIPENNTDPVRFYMGGDTAPGSSDSGYGVMLTSPVRSVISLNTSSRIQVGFREVAGSKPFDGATAQHYYSPYSSVESGGDIGFVVDTEDHDAGLMVQWNLGSDPGTQTYSMQTFVNKQGTSLTAAFRDGTIELGEPATLDLSVVNTQLSVSSNVGYTFVLPSGLTVGSAAPDNDCGGTLSAVAGSSTITLSGASVEATTNCLVSIPLVTAGAGAYRINAASVTSVNNVDNGVGGATLTVNGPQIAPAWQDQTIAAPTVDMPYTDGVSASGSPAPTYVVSAGSLPAGLSIDVLTGAITGAPSAVGPYDFTITASNGVGADLVKRFTGSVGAPTAPTWTDDTIDVPTAGTAFDDAVVAAGYPAPVYSITDGALPDGLTLDPTTGAITGTPTDEPGTPYDFTITADNGIGEPVSKQFSGEIAAPPAPSDEVELVTRAALTLDLEIGALAGSEATSIMVSGENLKPGSEFTLTMRSSPRILFNGIVGANGTINQRVMLPGDTPPGAHSVTLDAIGADGAAVSDVGYFKLSTDRRVVGVSMDTPFTDDDPAARRTRDDATRTRGDRSDRGSTRSDAVARLAFTGNSPVPLVTLGAVLLLAGSVLLERKRLFDALRPRTR